jgi:class 3 adenylate cyclase
VLRPQRETRSTSKRRRPTSAPVPARNVLCRHPSWVSRRRCDDCHAPQSWATLPAAVVFVDMVGFAALSERMAPDAVIAFVRDLLRLLSDSVFTHQGIVDKFTGDGLLAVFGPPIPSTSDASNAAHCALDMLQSFSCCNAQNKGSDDAAIQVAIGINYGEVLQGDVGSDNRLELTVLGDAVNVASRVEAYCRRLEAALLVTGAFVDALRAEGSENLMRGFVDEGRHLLRGYAEPIQLYGIRRSTLTKRNNGSADL